MPSKNTSELSKKVRKTRKLRKAQTVKGHYIKYVEKDEHLNVGNACIPIHCAHNFFVWSKMKQI